MSMFQFSLVQQEVHLHYMISTFLSRLYNLQARIFWIYLYLLLDNFEHNPKWTYHFRTALFQLASINLHSLNFLTQHEWLSAKSIVMSE
jgi:hypothetical protein